MGFKPESSDHNDQIYHVSITGTLVMVHRNCSVRGTLYMVFEYCYWNTVLRSIIHRKDWNFPWVNLSFLGLALFDNVFIYLS